MYFKLSSGWKAGASLAYHKSPRVRVLEYLMTFSFYVKSLSNDFFICAFVPVPRHWCHCTGARPCEPAGTRIRALGRRSHAPCLLAGLVVAFRPSKQEH